MTRQVLGREQKLPSYNEVSVVCFVDVNYNPTLADPFVVNALRRLTGLHPLVKTTDGRYFLARNMPFKKSNLPTLMGPWPVLKGILYENAGNISYAMNQKRIEVLTPHSKPTQVDVRKETQVMVVGDKKVGIGDQYVTFL